MVEEFRSKNAKIQLVQNKENAGFVGINSGFPLARGKYIVFLNNDTTFESGWLREVVKVIDADEEIGAAQPKVLVMNDPKRIENTGVLMDAFGFSRGRGRFEADRGQYDSNTFDEIFVTQGAVLIVRRRVLEEVGLFDINYFINHEDVDLCWRIRLRGYKVVLIPKAIVYHQPPARHPRPMMFLHMRKNRLLTLIKNYDSLNLVRVIPFVVFFYLLMFVKEALIDREFPYAVTSLSALWYVVRRRRYLLQQRWIIQHRIRRLPDREVLRLQSPMLVFEILRRGR
jgi:GT2 family glycosyltransferase